MLLFLSVILFEKFEVPTCMNFKTELKQHCSQLKRLQKFLNGGRKFSQKFMVLCLLQAQIKSYMLMLLKGVAFCHENSIMHRVGIRLH